MRSFWLCFYAFFLMPHALFLALFFHAFFLVRHAVPTVVPCSTYLLSHGTWCSKHNCYQVKKERQELPLIGCTQCVALIYENLANQRQFLPFLFLSGNSYALKTKCHVRIDAIEKRHNAYFNICACNTTLRVCCWKRVDPLNPLSLFWQWNFPPCSS